MHIGLLLLELGISDYDLNIKKYFHPNFKLRMAKWTFLACGVNEITKLKNTTDYYYYYFFFKYIQCLNLLFTLSITVLSGEWLIWCTLYVESNQSWNDLLLLGLSEPGGTGAIDPPPYFGRSVNPIEIRGADYAHHISTFPPPSGFSDLPTSLALQEPPFRFWMGLSTEDQLHFIVDSPRDMECSIDLSGI